MGPIQVDSTRSVEARPRELLGLLSGAASVGGRLSLFRPVDLRGRQRLEWVNRVLETVSPSEESKAMREHDVRKTFYPDNPEAHGGMVEILEVMVETWAPELQARIVGKASELGKIEGVCEVLGIALTDERRQQMEALDLGGGQALLASIERERDWPQG